MAMWEMGISDSVCRMLPSELVLNEALCWWRELHSGESYKTEVLTTCGH